MGDGIAQRLAADRAPLVGSSSERGKVFISYARADSERVDPICSVLKASGVRTFIDRNNLQYGLDWRNQLEMAISDCERLLVFWSEAAAASETVRWEYRTALAQPKCKVVPIMMDETALPTELGDRHGVPFSQFWDANAAQGQGGLTSEEQQALATPLVIGSFTLLEHELMQTRADLRLWNAIANCDIERWFGGSKDLHMSAYRSLLDGVLMRIWRMTDPVEINAIPAALKVADAADAGTAILSMPETRHVRHYVRHRLVAPQEALLTAEPSEWLPSVGKNKIQLRMLCRIASEISAAYTTHINPAMDGSLDWIRQYGDPFLDTFQDRGLPVIDFPPSAIFR